MTSVIELFDVLSIVGVVIGVAGMVALTFILDNRPYGDDGLPVDESAWEDWSYPEDWGYDGWEDVR